MPESNLRKFLALAAQQRSLQANICQAETPEAIVALAGALGYTISPHDLRKASRDLAAHYWPWSGQGVERRRLFFASQRFKIQRSRATKTHVPV